jgi:hypothetical protein
MSAGSSMKINSLPAKSGFCKNLTKTKSQQLFSIFSIVGKLNGLIWWNKKKFEYFHLIWDSRFLQADALNRLYYCSSVWLRLQIKTCYITKLQSVQNFAARLVTKTRKFDHITSQFFVRIELELNTWLAVNSTLNLKDAVMTFNPNILSPNILIRKI